MVANVPIIAYIQSFFLVLLFGNSVIYLDPIPAAVD